MITYLQQIGQIITQLQSLPIYLSFIIIPWFGFWSLANGRDWVSQGIILAVAPLILVPFLPWYYVLLFTGSYALYNIPGWGAGLVALHGNKHLEHHGEIVYDLITKHIEHPYVQGVASMGLRSLYLIPFFIGGAFISKNYYTPLVGSCMFLQGVLYYTSGQFFKEITKAMAVSEFTSGCLIGLLTTWMIFLVKQ